MCLSWSSSTFQKTPSIYDTPTSSEDCQSIAWMEKRFFVLPKEGNPCQNSTQCNAHLLHDSLQTADLGKTFSGQVQRCFLWRGKDPERVKGGHCLVKWKICMRPKKWGGLGIKDSDKFGRALRLHWLWYNWDCRERPWKSLLHHQDKVDRQLFFLPHI